MSIGVIYTIIIVCVLAMVMLIGIAIFMYMKNNDKSESTSMGNSSNSKGAQTKTQGIESMSKFLEFEEIVDSMIVRKNRQQYVMVIQCKGVNYDLLGSEEKIAVENGFIQFLNTLRFPIQLYVQTRSLNLKDSIDKYTEKIDQIKEQIAKLDVQIKKEKANERPDLVRRMEFDRRRKMNILEYGMDITNYVGRMSQNRNVLQQNTYLIVTYYTAEFGGEIANYSKEEVNNIAFSELYTRAQTAIRALASSGVTGRVITSEELAELLYIAYNRDDSELISIKRSIDANYDSLYNTAKDVLEKQKEMIESKIDEEALGLAAKSITRADRIRKIREEHKREIKERALQYVEDYKNEMTEDLYTETKRQIEKADLTQEQHHKKVRSNEEKVKRRKAIAEEREEKERPKMAKRKIRPTESKV